MKRLYYFIRLGCCLFIFGICNNSLYAQCGAPPTSGTTTISTSKIVNTYYPGTGSPTTGLNHITLGTIDARGADTVIGVNDMIVIMQMQGADINTTNAVNYGGNNSAAPANGYLSTNLVAGNYEYATVTGVSGAILTLSVALTNNYYTRTFTSTNSIQTYQVIRVPRYYNLTISSTGIVTAPSWNGATGGVVILDAAGTLTITGSINVASLGFRGGGGKQLGGATSGDGNSSTNTSGGTNLVNTDYRFNSPITNVKNLTGGAKGEGIAGTPAYSYSNGATTTTTGSVEGYINGSMGRGAPGNAGGGGTDGQPLNQNQSNSGGGGGSNAGAGGQGGSGWPAGNGTNDVNQYPYGGYGGAALTQGSLQRIIMGGGGGAGTANNSTSTNEYNTSGGPGGGIIVTRALLYSGGGSVNADGANGPGVTSDVSQTDAAGGGGAGGTIIIVTYFTTTTTGLGSITASAKGGTGGYMTTYYNHGPGGGGGGGYIYVNGTLGSTNVTGGAQGYTRTGSTGGTINNAYNTTAGSVGKVVTLSTAPLFYCGVLPVVLTSFNAVVNGSSVDLLWHVEKEINFSYFEIEYSKDGINFERIGTAAYINNLSDYHFIHQSPKPGRNFYRLRLVDIDGKFTYSNILLVNINAAYGDKLLIYPNPASKQITLQFNATAKQQIDVQIFDNAGRSLIFKKMLAEKGNNYMPIPDIRNLATGIYMIMVNIDSKIFTEKLVIGKY